MVAVPCNIEVLEMYWRAKRWPKTVGVAQGLVDTEMGCSCSPVEGSLVGDEMIESDEVPGV